MSYKADTTKFKNSDQDKILWVNKKCSQAARNEKERGTPNDRGKRRDLDKDKLLLLCHNECPCCKNPLDYSLRKDQIERGENPREMKKHIPSIDRIDSSKQYSDDNVRIMCLSCNMIKGEHYWSDVMAVALFLYNEEKNK